MGKHWKYQDTGNGVANIFCPTLTEARVDSFTVKKEIYKEFQVFERKLREKFSGWVSWTELQNDHIMLFCAKSGAKPFDIDIKTKRIWFYKKF